MNKRIRVEERIIPAQPAIYLDGPKHRILELTWVWRIAREFIRAVRLLHFAGPCITVFGSARFDEFHPYYLAAEEFGKRIAQLGLTTMTGGGPGIMEAANKGAFESGGSSIGCNIKLPFEQKANPWVNATITFDHFFTRKVILVKYSYGFIIMPGGFGTMDEFFETLTLVQTKSITQFPIVLFGKEYYKPLMDYMHFMANQKTIAADDLKLVLLTDDIDHAMLHIKTYIKQNYTIKPRKRLWWLFEKR